MGLFGQGKKKDPKEMVREWNSQLRKEGRKLDRQINSIQREENKIKVSLKDAAKKGHKDVCQILAKEVINSRRAIGKIHSAKAHIKSVEYGLNAQLANLRVAGALERSTDVMKCMQNLLKVSDIRQSMMEMSKEMMKAGIIEEMLEDVMELDDADDLEEETQEQVDKILWEITKGDIGRAPDAVNDTLPTVEPEELEGATGGEEEEDVTEMQARLEALRS